MRIKLLTLRYSATLGGFDERPIEEFTRDKELVAFREHFFTVHDVPHLTCVLTWQDAVVDEADRAALRDVARGPRRDGRGEPKPKADPTAGMDEADRLLFNRLRAWRATRAREDGLPPYVIFNNRELAAIVGARPASPNALGHVPGVGPAKVEKHGAQVLAIVNGAEDPA